MPVMKGNTPPSALADLIMRVVRREGEAPAEPIGTALRVHSRCSPGGSPSAGYPQPAHSAVSLHRHVRTGRLPIRRVLVSGLRIIPRRLPSLPKIGRLEFRVMSHPRMNPAQHRSRASRYCASAAPVRGLLRCASRYSAPAATVRRRLQCAGGYGAPAGPERTLVRNIVFRASNYLSTQV